MVVPGHDEDPRTREYRVTTQTPDLEVLREMEPRECAAVAVAATAHVGKGYRITRELSPDTVDCSTLVSQAHWLGAAIQTPFIAESQRLAQNGKDVEGEEIIPGDCLYAYASRESSPGGKHNHVAMYVGEDSAGHHWAIESADPVGVRFVPLESVRREGGIRRFCPSPQSRFGLGQWDRLASSVPKLGRLGARLTSRHASTTRHPGTDIYVDHETSVRSPLAGHVVALRPLGRGEFAVTIGRGDGMVTVLAPVLPLQATVGEYVDGGSVIGRLGTVKSPHCNAIPGFGGRARLHWELWAIKSEQPSPSPGLCPDQGLGAGVGKSQLALSPIYMVKSGALEPPVDLS